MHRRVSWMVPADEAILRLLAPPKKLELTPSNIARNTGYGSRHIRDRCKELVAEGLLEVDRDDSHPYYSTTDKGERFLEGELDASDFEKDEE